MTGRLRLGRQQGAALLPAVVSLAVLAHCGSDDHPGQSLIDTGGAGGSNTTDASAPGSGGMGNVLLPVGGSGAEPSTPDAGAADVGCGNGRIDTGEICDDGNSDAADGCSADCLTIENGFACPTPGALCVSTLICGDAKIGGNETCDDGNEAPGDGCDDTCMLEPGWSCPVVGARCEAASCGDAIIAGAEQCEDDDAPPTDGDGCSAACRNEPGFACDAVGVACRVTVCNDGVKEGSEPCDDGNLVIGDGCSPFCEVEPDCSAGACVSACGDGIILPGDAEQCDDGNTLAGDGCDGTCTTEEGWTCERIQAALPDTLEVPITYRDFNRAPIAPPVDGGGPDGGGPDGGAPTQHPDFEAFAGGDRTAGMVEDRLGADGKPGYTGICEAGSSIGPCPYGDQTTSESRFAEWYSNTHPTQATVVTRMTLTRVGTTDAYRTAPGQLFPLDDQGWVALGQEEPFDGHNFGFTSEIRTWFEFKGGEQLDFSGDDDVWVFINGQLVLDLGGLHPQRSGSFTLNADGTASWSRLREDGNLVIEGGIPDGGFVERGTVDPGLEVGRVYEIVLFHAERHTNQSNFELTLGGFTTSRTSCAPTCGDGFVVGDEVCDDGVNDGSYGSCTADCMSRGPFCGDGTVQSPDEACDDGINLTTYQRGSSGACAPGCRVGAACGDGKVDALFGEQCDDGTNDGSYGGCEPDCRLAPRCGDRTVQADRGESCDDGNTVSGDGCTNACKLEIVR